MLSRKALIIAPSLIFSFIGGYVLRYYQETSGIDINLENRAISKIESKWPIALKRNIGIGRDYTKHWLDMGHMTCIKFAPNEFISYGSAFLYCEDQNRNMIYLNEL